MLLFRIWYHLIFIAVNLRNLSLSTGFSNPVGAGITAEACNALLEDIEAENIKLLRIDEEIFRKAIEVFTRFVDNEWSFTDCTSYPFWFFYVNFDLNPYYYEIRFATGSIK